MRGKGAPYDDVKEFKQPAAAGSAIKPRSFMRSKRLGKPQPFCGQVNQAH